MILLSKNETFTFFPYLFLHNGPFSSEFARFNPMTSLCGQLQTMMEGYFTKYPNMSVNALAAKSGVGASTLRRILSDGLKGDPAPHTVLNIASAVTREKRLSVLITMFDGPLGELLKETFSPFVEMNMNHEMDHEINEELKDFTKYMIYKCAANDAGVRSSWVMDNYGKAGLAKMNELFERGFLTAGPELFHAKQKNFSLDLEIAVSHLSEMVRFYKPSELSKGKNLYYTLSESLNDEAIKKVKKIQLEAIQKIYDVMSDKKSLGPTHYMSVSIMDTLESGSDDSGVLQ